ncbi:MAG: hypothetical protein VXW65_03440, partial [Pseudomonadota bacterium]|nr:hypothetical protein [Pseudomonadota bacterium]
MGWTGMMKMYPSKSFWLGAVGRLAVGVSVVTAIAGCTPEQMSSTAQILGSVVSPVPQAPMQPVPNQQIPNYTQTGQIGLDRTNYRSGEQVQVSFRAPAGLPNNAWIGVIPSHIPHGDESVNDQHDVAYRYLQGRTSGTMTFTAPAAGRWDIRMHTSDSSGVEIASTSFTVY